MTVGRREERCVDYGLERLTQEFEVFGDRVYCHALDDFGLIFQRCRNISDGLGWFCLNPARKRFPHPFDEAIFWASKLRVLRVVLDGRSPQRAAIASARVRKNRSQAFFENLNCRVTRSYTKFLRVVLEDFLEPIVVDVSDKLAPSLVLFGQPSEGHKAFQQQASLLN